MGRELERIGAPFRQPEWSALALIETPDMVTQTHQNFIDAGAQIITTNAYAVIPHHIGEERFKSDGRKLIRLSAEIASKVAEKNRVKVAGCIPPLFGSYLPDQFDERRVDNILMPFIEEQDDAIDQWIIETVSSTQEAITIGSKLSKHTNKHIWLSFTTHRIDKDHITLRHGNYIDQAITELLDYLIPDAILLNCCDPFDVLDGLKIIRKTCPDIPCGAYANNFASNDKRTEGSNKVITKLNSAITPEIYADLSQTWVDAGATIIGGCCGIGPDHISALAKKFT